MAPTIALKFGPTLRMGVGSTAGAMADCGLAAEGSLAAAKRQKMAGDKVPQVSLNRNGARRRMNSPRLSTAKAAAGAKGPEVIPSDDNTEFSDERMLSTMSGPRKVGHTTPGKAAKLFVEVLSAEARDFAVKGVPTPAPLAMDDNNAYVRDAASNAVSKPRLTAAAAMHATAVANDVFVSGQVVASLRTERSSGDPWKDRGAVPACDEPNDRTQRLPNDRTHRLLAKAAGGLAPPGDDLAPSGVSTATEGNEEDEYDNIPKQLPHGMADLRAAMAMEGMTAFRFTDAIDAFDMDNNWADKYGTFFASLHDKATALATAFSLAAKSQAYLALLPKVDTFIVVHRLHWWVTVPPPWSVNEGRLVAFEGETLGEDSRKPPDLLRFNGEENKLFKVLSLSEINLGQVASFCDGNVLHRNSKRFHEASFGEVKGVRLGCLIPIPTAWAAVFLDYPNVGTALRQVQVLISLVVIEKVENFKLLAYSMTYAGFLLPDLSDATSVLELDWKRLPRVKLNMTWRIKTWEAGKWPSSETKFDEGESPDKQKAPPEEIDPFLAIFGWDRQPRSLFPGVQTCQAPSWGGSPYGAQVQPGLGQHPAHPTAMPSRHPTAKPTNASLGGARARGPSQPPSTVRGYLQQPSRAWTSVPS
jgi:hypothetical protein